MGLVGNLLAKIKSKGRVSCIHLTPVFEGVFSVPEPRGKLGISLSLGAFIERERSKFL